MHKTTLGILGAALLSSTALAQTPSHVIISTSITQTAGGAGVQAPLVPGGGFNVGPYWWVADANAVASYTCRDAANTTPLETCLYPANPNQAQWSFVAFAGFTVDSFGQAVKANDTTVYAASYSKSKGGSLAGIYRLTLQTPLPAPGDNQFIFAGAELLANQNLHGNEPTAFELDQVNHAGYVGFLKANILDRIDVNNTAPNAPAVVVGSIPGARSIYGLKFVGTKLYAAADNGLWVFGANSDITQCSGNANGCGTPQLLRGGAFQCVEADGNSLYTVTLTGILYRLNTVSGVWTQIDAGRRPEGGHSAMCVVDGDHNFALGEMPIGADIPNSGTVRIYDSTDLFATQ